MVRTPVLFIPQPKVRGLRVLLRSLPKHKAGTMLNVEFTVEPFVEGSPGAHVTAAVAAVERCGLSVDFGPFGSSFFGNERTVAGRDCRTYARGIRQRRNIREC